MLSFSHTTTVSCKINCHDRLKFFIPQAVTKNAILTTVLAPCSLTTVTKIGVPDTIIVRKRTGFYTYRSKANRKIIPSQNGGCEETTSHNNKNYAILIRRISAPRAFKRSSILSYPRSIWWIF